jgi:uncharacterized membrane protein
MEESNAPLITNDAIVLGILMVILSFVFYTSGSAHPGWRRFYKFVPALLLCYLFPALLSTYGVISGEQSKLPSIASKFLLPASLVLLCVSIDLKGLMKLGPKSLILFLTGTAGIIIGGPVALFLASLMFPEITGGDGPDAAWRGFSTVAGSWIGGGANQVAMKEVFQPSTPLFAIMAVIDMIVASTWMAVLLYGAGITKRIDKWLKADVSSIDTLRDRIENYSQSIMKIPSLTDLVLILGVGFGATALSHAGADIITPWMKANAPELAKFSFHSDFFWIVIIATTLGLLLSFTPTRRLEGAGASKIGSVFLYFLVTTIGMQMNIKGLEGNGKLIVVGVIWMIVHALLLLLVAKLIRAPFFFVAVGSQANVGGAASAPVVASAFHPSLAPVGVLLAVLGYALGTYGGWICAMLMQTVQN